MSWVFAISFAILLIAVVLIELRAARTGDERRHHAPGYDLVMGGLILTGVGLAGAVMESAAMALAGSFAGLVLVVLGARREGTAATH